MRLTSHNQDARQPADTSEWPPAMVIDFWYGCAVLRAWGIEESVSSLNDIAGAAYYDQLGEDLKDDSAGVHQPIPGRSRTVRGNSTTSRADRYKKPQDRQQGLDMGHVIDAVSCLWMKSAKRRPESQATRCRQKVEYRQKVQDWLRAGDNR